MCTDEATKGKKMGIKLAAAILPLVALAVPFQNPAYGQTSSEIDQQKHRYDLNFDSAHDCSIIQINLKELAEADRPEWAPAHRAMNLTWYALALELKGGEITDEDDESSVARLMARSPDGGASLANLIELAKTCEIISNLHDVYRETAVAEGKKYPDLFAERAAFKLQTGGEVAPAPVKELVIDEWIFSAKRNSCLAGYAFDDGAVLTLRFTNFGDGSIVFSWDGLPEISLDDGTYDKQMKSHYAGIGFGDNDEIMIADGYDYSSFPGTGIFADEQLVIGVSGGMSAGNEHYSFGHAVQSTYYNQLAGSKELSVKVLGQETHRVRLQSAALWNELSRCAAQYPFG